MAVHHHDGPAAARQSYARLRKVGIVILLAGLMSAGVLYVVRSRSAGPSMDELLPGYTKMQRRQMGILFGGTGIVLSEGLDDLTHPGTQAAIIALASILFAWGCFYVARGLEQYAEDLHDPPPADQ